MADDKLNTDYYDEVDDSEHERSAENTSEPDRASRDLWQSTTVGTDGSGPQVHEVAPIFAQARADALANPVTADGDDDVLRDEQAESAAEAQAEADRIRQAPGYSAKTGADAGQYDDPSLEGRVPPENFNPAPKADGEERSVADAQAEEQQNVSGEQDTTETARRGPDATGAESAGGASPEAPEYGSAADNSGVNTEDKTHSDLVSDTAGEQGGLDETSAPDATPKVN